MDTVIVTGGAGFIGSALVRALLARPDTRVVCVDLLTYAGNLDNLRDIAEHPRFTFVHGDIGDRATVARFLDAHAPRAVLHLAAETHVDRSIDGPELFAANNVLGTVRLLDETLFWWRSLPAAAQASFRFVNVSTDEVFGTLGPGGRFHEGSPYAPRSPYAASKAAADHFARAFHHTYGLPVVTTHCSNNYGPRQFPEKLVPLWLLNAIAGAPLPVYGDGQHVRDWLHVDDHATGLLAALDRGVPGATYTFGGGEERTNLAMAAEICAAVAAELGAQRDVASLVQHVPDRPGHDRRYAIDDTRTRTALGWAPRIPLTSGLRETVRWYLANPAWVERVRSGGYRGERLGLGR